MKTVRYILSFLILLAAGVALAAPNDTTAGKATAAAVNGGAANQIELYMPYTGDSDANNNVYYIVKECRNAAYAGANTPVAHSATPYSITIGALNSDTCYDIRAAYNDAVVSGANVQLVRINSTWDNTLLHNINRFAAGNSSKWTSATNGAYNSLNGGWGVANTAASNSKYGRFLCDTCHSKTTTNIKRIRSAINAPNPSFGVFNSAIAGGAVNFKTTDGVAGTNDTFGDDTFAHAASTKICEVCHSKTKYHTYASANAVDLTHNNAADCVSCHPHSNGFYPSASCDTCHGDPPVSVATLASPATGATNNGTPQIGAHNAHAGVGGKGMTCDLCHTGFAMNNAINLGFVINGTNWPSWASTNTVTTGDYNGTSRIYTGYSWASSSAGTNVNTNTSWENSCSVYCHGNWANSGGDNSRPSWIGGANYADCGKCHGASSANAPQVVSHPQHVGIAARNQYGFACTLCHNNNADTNHVSGTVTWQLNAGDTRIGSANYRGAKNGATNTIAPSTSYGRCDSLYCHSNAAPLGGGNSTFATPTWGSTISTCDVCHRTSGAREGSMNATPNGNPATNLPGRMSLSHQKHLATDLYSFTCDECHANTAAPNSTSALNGQSAYTSFHVNNLNDVKFSWTGANNNINQSAGTYNTPSGSLCASIYCHSKGGNTSGTFNAPNTNVSWVGGSTNCYTCHGTGDSAANMATAGPFGSHDKHIATNFYDFTCDECHADTAAQNSTAALNGASAYNKHVNGVKNLKFTQYYGAGNNINMSSANYNAAAGNYTCNSTYCHSRGNSVAANNFAPPLNNTASINWSGGAANCYACHGNSDSAANVNAAFNVPGAPGAPNGGKHVMHASTNYPGGTGASANGYKFSCSDCHFETVENDSSGNIAGANGYKAHVNGAVNVKYSTTLRASTLDQSGGGVNGVGGTGGFNSSNGPVCSNLYCHSQGTRRYPGAWNAAFNYIKPNVAPISTASWTGGALACNGCHGEQANGAPNYRNDTSGMNAKANSHQPHIAAGYTCYQCHSNTTNGTGNILSPLSHVSGAYNVSNSAGTLTYTPGAVNMASSGAGSNAFGAPNGGTCSGTFGCHGNYTWGGPSMTCVSCHSAALGTGGSNSRRQITATGTLADGTGGNNNSGDFIRASRHVNNGSVNGQIVTKWDCIVCHMAGEPTTGGTNGANHYTNLGAFNNVMLRNVDSRGTGWIWNRFVAYSGGNSSDPKQAYYTDTVVGGASANQMRWNMDRFCLGCHDANGASQIAVNNGNRNTGDTNSGLLLDQAGANTVPRYLASANTTSTGKVAALRPFNWNDRLINNWDTVAGANLRLWKDGYSAANAAAGANYGRIVDVKSQFNSVNANGSAWASHHNLALYFKRYGTRNTTYWPNDILSQVTLKNSTDAGTNGTLLRVKGETSGLHCSDCHLNEANAHGAKNSRFMLDTINENVAGANGAGAMNALAGDQTWVGTEWTGATQAGYSYVCFKCHNVSTYNGGGVNGRGDHGWDNGSPWGTVVPSPMGIQCFTCHGGYSSTQAGVNGQASGGLGSIHGTNEAYAPTNAGANASRRYRFMNGATMRYYKPDAKANTYTDPTDWTNTTVTSCYTVAADDLWTTGCTKHGAGIDTGNGTINYTKPLDW